MEFSDLGRAGDWRSYLVPFDELTPAPQGLHHGGRLQLQRVDAGPGARHGQARGSSGTHGAPTGTDGAVGLSTRSRAARSGPAASAPARPPASQSVPDGLETRRPAPPPPSSAPSGGAAPSHRVGPARPAAAPPGGRGGDCIQREDGADLGVFVAAGSVGLYFSGVLDKRRELGATELLRVHREG